MASLLDQYVTQEVQNKSSYDQIARTAILENQTTYSGSDIRVFVYRDIATLVDETKNVAIKNDVSFTPYDPSQEEIDRAELYRDKTVRGYLTGNDGSIQYIDDPEMAKGLKELGSERFKKGSDIEKKRRDILQRNALSSRKAAENKQKKSGSGAVIKEIGSLQSINYSTFREKVAVRTFGRTHAKAYTRGQRTIAGTMNFAILQTHELLKFANEGIDRIDQRIALLDQMEPFHMILLFMNEYGSASMMHLFNVDINTESQSMTFEDLITTNTLNFFAQDMLPIEGVGNFFNSTQDMLHAIANQSSFQETAAKIANKSSLFSRGLSSSGTQDSDRVQQLLQRSRGLF